MVHTKSYISWPWDAKHEGQACYMAINLGQIFEIKTANNRHKGLMQQGRALWSLLEKSIL